MLRLQSTTLSLTMTEVKEFERHRRFRNYLAKDATFELPIRPGPPAPDAQKAPESEPRGDSKQSEHETDSKQHSRTNSQESPTKLLANPPRRPPKSSGSSASNSNTQGPSSSSQSKDSNSSTLSQRPAGFGLPMRRALPPPFSTETRRVSDEHSLPSTRSLREDTRQEPPATPPRRSSLQNNRPAGSTSPLPSGGAIRVFSSAARFVESIIRRPRADSPSSTRATRSESGSPIGEDASDRTLVGDPRLTIYNDALPASSQPQTPQNLPEARHQSRISGAYTAPVPRMVTRSMRRTGAIRGRPDNGRSPNGLNTPGFHGLYGGMENSEDSRLYDEASRLREEGSQEPDPE
ncbi:Uu.00g066780.m01.CDS01 [Anthostomella pinea]|uniref:Uu.00g066780.m01.CDS01 n=1 Tax=Anthostomella pinea TaxID=933095 RepID=A0AAI8VV79_9PEZI|nr:Uu.00g066780.m01.CDS01 [Anthostomella pinea]